MPTGILLAASAIGLLAVSVDSPRRPSPGARFSAVTAAGCQALAGLCLSLQVRIDHDADEFLKIYRGLPTQLLAGFVASARRWSTSAGRI